MSESKTKALYRQLNKNCIIEENKTGAGHENKPLRRSMGEK